MRIAQIIPSLRATGPVNVAVDLARQLHLSGHEVHLFYLDNVVEQDVGQVPAHPVGRGTIEMLRQFDVVHSHCLRPDYFVFKHRRSLRHVQKITTIHNIVHQDLQYAYNKVVASLVACIWIMLWRWTFDVFAVLNDFSVSYYSRYLPGEKLYRIYNGRALQTSAGEAIDTEVERTISEWKRRGLVIFGSCAVLLQRKGLEQILSFLARDIHFAYVVVGDGPARAALEGQMSSLGLRDRVLFVGHKKNVEPYLKEMDLFALPSRSEGLPLAALEATSIGLPILCSDIPIFREIFTEECASFFTLDNADSIAKAVNSMVIRRKTMGAEAQRRYRRHFTVRQMADNYLAVYAKKSSLN